ncbi:MAG: aconitate hydratase [bacterium]|nr:aconitate hydratase [bacterium]
MGLNLTQKIIRDHLIEGDWTKPGSPIAIRIDQTLTQDATGTMAYLQFEALGLKRVKTELSVSYVDHNMLQTGFENADDHAFLQDIAYKYGIYFSKPGNGICHQVHLERFGRPGGTLLGSDSHTPTNGGIGMLAIGAGGLDVALAMAGEPFRLNMPKVVKVHLVGTLRDFVSAKDVILEVLRRLTVKGGVGKVMEYVGEGILSLGVPERSTITNMGAELGATSSIFPSDEITLEFLKRQKRADVWKPYAPDPDAEYDEVIEIDLSTLDCLIACPHSPDNVKPVREVAGKLADQVAIGSCTNSSYRDLMTVSEMLRGKTVHPRVSAALFPGSRQILNQLILNGGIAPIVQSGFRIMESACGACIGMGFAPPTGGVTVRTFNRNFEGRTGTKFAFAYLCSPEVAVATAIAGEITDPRDLNFGKIQFSFPEEFFIDDSNIIAPAKEDEAENVSIRRGPNIQPLPTREPLGKELNGSVLLKVGDNITTDHIMPAGAKVLPLRSNIPKISEYVFEIVDPTFAKRAKEAGGGFVVGGNNYGQGSSREHAALAPMYLGVKAVLVKSFARIHLANLINFGILPLFFVNEKDYDLIEQGDELHIDVSSIQLDSPLTVVNLTKNQHYLVKLPITSQRQLDILLAGGTLSYVKQKGVIHSS